MNKCTILTLCLQSYKLASEGQPTQPARELDAAARSAAAILSAGDGRAFMVADEWRTDERKKKIAKAKPKDEPKTG